MTTALDQADLWLLQNDPQLSDKSAEFLLNRKIRNAHCLGAEFFDETMEIHQNENPDPDPEAFLQFIEKQNWLNPEVKTLVLGIAQDQCLSRIGQALGGITKQAVYKRLQKHRAAIQYLIKIWQGQDNDPVSAAEWKPIPCFVDKNQQLAFDFGGAQ